MYNYCCTNFVVQILLYATQCALIFSHIKNCVLKIILGVLFEFRSKDKYERRMFSRLKRNFKRKIYINTFCLMSYFSLAPADEQTIKEWNKTKIV